MAGCSGNSQENQKCTVGLSNAPEVRGLRLGMSVEEFKAKFPLTTRSTLRSVNPDVIEPGVPMPDRFGAVNMPAKTFGVLSETEVTNNPQLKGIRIRQVLFVDGRLAHFRIIYSDDTVKWEDLAEFAVKTSESLSLPVASWQPKQGVAKSFLSSEYDYDSDVREFDKNLYLTCDEVAIVTGFLSGKHYDGGRTPFIQMDDLKAVRTLSKREYAWEAAEKAKKEHEEGERRKAFKP